MKLSPAPSPGDPASGGTLRAGSLSVWAITFFVVSAAGPLVAMAGGVPIAMLFGNGAGIPALFLAAMLILCLFSIGYTSMARHVKSTGGFYAYTRAGLGVAAGGASGLVALLSYNSLQIALYGLFGTAADALLSTLLGIHLAWWIYALAALASIAFFGYRQIDLSVKVLGTLVAGEYLAILALDGSIIAASGETAMTWRPFLPSVFAQGSPWVGLMLCFSAFIGFEATTIYSEEARDPERSIPRATYCAVLLIGSFYTLSTWAVVIGAGIDQLLPALQALPDPTRLLFILSDRYMGQTASVVMRILFVTSIYASLLAFHNAIARYFLALGRSGVLPSTLAMTHRTFQSPHIGSLVQSALALLAIAVFGIAGADPVLTVFTLPTALATLGVIVLMATAAAAIFMYFFRCGGIGPARLASVVVSAIVLAGVAVLAALNFDVLTGSGALVARLLPMLLLATALVGAGLALRASPRH